MLQPIEAIWSFGPVPVRATCIIASYPKPSGRLHSNKLITSAPSCVIGIMRKTQPTVFYDGSCPLCRREIGFYQRQDSSEAVRWVDVSQARDRDVASELSCQAAMARFHVMTHDGTLKSGAAAFAELWTWLPRFRLAGQIARLPGIVHALEIAYRLFLPARPLLQTLARHADRKQV